MNKLIESWSYRIELPLVYQRFCNNHNDGKKYKSNRNVRSKYNNESGMVSLHPPTVAALVKIAELVCDQTENCAAIGFQKVDDKLNYYCLEYPTPEGRIVLVYNPQNGKFTGSMKVTGELQELKSLELGSTGEEYMAMFIAASLMEDSSLYDEELSHDFRLFRMQYDCNWGQPEIALDLSLRLCDNIVRRIGLQTSIEDGTIPVDNDQFSIKIPMLSERLLQTGIYNPNTAIMGTFQILTEVKGRTSNIKVLKQQYHWGKYVSPEDQTKIPALPEEYEVGEGVLEILDMIIQSSARLFMLTGEAGLGKTTDAKMIAQVLGLPYYCFTCGPETTETELLANPLPNMGRDHSTEINWPNYIDMEMDPPSALASITHEYDGSLDAEEAFEKICKSAFQKGYEMAKKEKDFVMVESSIIQACRRPSLVEVQEPAMIEKAGTLVKLNALFDEDGVTELLNGERIVRHPDTIVIMTTNLNYIGCENFNESVLSRMKLIQHRIPLTKEQMVDRVLKRTKIKDVKLLEEMAEIVLNIKEHMQKQELTGGVAGYREYEAWVEQYLINGNILRSAENTLISKVSMIQAEREDIRKTYIDTHFSSVA